jgi:polysaccharide export outer membrane protein
MTAFWSANVTGAILSALLSIGVSCLLRVTPRHAVNAATRYAIWWIVLAVTLLLPLTYFKWQREGIPVARPVQFAAIRIGPVSAPLVPARSIAADASASTAYAVSLPVRILASEWLRPLLNLWITGGLILLIRVFIGYAALYRLSARASDAPPELSCRAEKWLRRPVRLALSDEIEIPIATGPLRPTILIPTRLFHGMTGGDLEQIGLHEATHLARRDDCLLFLQRVIEALFALHPVVRWLTRQIDLEREIACDDVVARSTENPRSYADCLTRMLALCGGVRTSLAAASAADSRSHFSRRVEFLLGERRRTETGILRGRCAMIAIALVAAVGVLVRTPLLVAFEVPPGAHIASASIAVAQPLPAPQVVEAPPITIRRPVLVAQVKPAVPEILKPPQRPPGNVLYILGPNDVIQVTVFDEPRISSTYSIGPDGYMSMPLIGNFKATDMTIPQLTELLTTKLRDQGGVSNPVVNVQLLRNNSKEYTLIGGVVRPGPHPLLKTTTILDALAASGGFKDFVDLKNIKLRRGTREFHFNYNQVIQGEHMEQNLTLEDGDFIIVPEPNPPPGKKP